MQCQDVILNRTSVALDLITNSSGSAQCLYAFILLVVFFLFVLWCNNLEKIVIIHFLENSYDIKCRIEIVYTPSIRGALGSSKLLYTSHSMFTGKVSQSFLCFQNISQSVVAVASYPVCRNPACGFFLHCN